MLGGTLMALYDSGPGVPEGVQSRKLRVYMC